MKRDYSWWLKTCIHAAPKEVGYFMHCAAFPAAVLRSWTRSALKSNRRSERDISQPPG
jgi:hypothetical protein